MTDNESVPTIPCPRCDGQGWYEVTKTGMAPNPENPEEAIPIPVLAQEQCAECGGYGDIETSMFDI